MDDARPQGQLITQPTGVPPGAKPWSTGLGKLLLDVEDGRSAVRLIAINKTLRAEAERLLPMLERLKDPAEDEEVLAILVRHAPHYGVQAKSAGEWAAMFDAYLDALGGLSAYMIEDAFLRWNRGEGHANLQMASFYPKSGQLCQLAQAAKGELIMAAYRTRQALDYVDPRPPPPEVRKEVGHGLTDLLGELQASRGRAPGSRGAAHPMADPYPPSISPQQMAARLRRHADAAQAPSDYPDDVV